MLKNVKVWFDDGESAVFAKVEVVDGPTKLLLLADNGHEIYVNHSSVLLYRSEPCEGETVSE